MQDEPSGDPKPTEQTHLKSGEQPFDMASQNDPALFDNADVVDAETAVELAGAATAPAEPEAPEETLPAMDLLSHPAVPLDLHSQPVAATAPTTPLGPEQIATSATTEPTDQVPPATATPASPATPAAQATQAVVDTAKQAAQTVTAAAQTVTTAAQNVTAAVQQQAQKITVAPRKALYRGKRFIAVYGTAVGVAGIIALLARKHRYFVGDVGITRLIQHPKARLYEKLMYAVSNLGWRWISVGARASAGTLMWAAGFRMESAFTFSTWTGDVLTVLIKTRVLRPRPTKDLVHVVSELEEASFPSGHVVHYVTFYGFLFYLVFTHLKQRWFRTAFLTVLSSIIILIGPSRVYMGHHWPSDVGGAYLVGTLWLGLIIIAYIETKANYTIHTYPPYFIKRPQQLAPKSE